MKKSGPVGLAVAPAPPPPPPPAAPCPVAPPTPGAGIGDDDAATMMKERGGAGMGVRRLRTKTPIPCTGTAKRMKHLPSVKHVVHRKHREDDEDDDGGHQDQVENKMDCEDEAFGPPYVNVLGEEHNRPESTILRCVYNYEDKYRFSRILSNETLCFDSHFESANLRMAHRVMGEDRGALPSSGQQQHHPQQEYDLILHHDVHSRGHVQWYYFSVSNTVANKCVRFNIINMSKFESLYAEGMRPVLFSQTAAIQGKGWHRCGTSIKYYPTDHSYYLRLAGTGSGPATTKGTTLYTLSFTVRFEATSDVCFLAYCYPYTYTDLHRHLHALQASAVCLRRSLLCKTLGGNWCDVLTITSPSRRLDRVQRRPGIVLTGRVHPGESNASFVMKGVIDFLVSSHPKAKALRDRYVFKIVPMLNPDGVVNGNYRTSLAGADLNRQWDNPDPLLHPTIYHTKKLIEDMLCVRPVALICDLHGHSRRQGTFMYACIPERTATTTTTAAADAAGGVSASEAAAARLLAAQEVAEQVRLFPQAMAGLCPSFAPESCSSRMHKSKASTMRIVMYTSHDVYNAYTLETSLAGAHGRHFTPSDLARLGVDFCISILAFRRRLKEMHRHRGLLFPPSSYGGGGVVAAAMGQEMAAGRALSPAAVSVGTFESSVGVPTEEEEEEDWAAESDNEQEAVCMSPVLTNGQQLPLTPRRIFHLPFRSSFSLGDQHQVGAGEGEEEGGPLASNTTAPAKVEGTGPPRPPSHVNQEDSSGSDSNPSGDNLNDVELAKNMRRAGLVEVAKGLLLRSRGPSSTTAEQEEEYDKATDALATTPPPPRGPPAPGSRRQGGRRSRKSLSSSSSSGKGHRRHQHHHKHSDPSPHKPEGAGGGGRRRAVTAQQEEGRYEEDGDDQQQQHQDQPSTTRPAPGRHRRSRTQEDATAYVRQQQQQQQQDLVVAKRLPLVPRPPPAAATAGAPRGGGAADQDSDGGHGGGRPMPAALRRTHSDPAVLLPLGQQQGDIAESRRRQIDHDVTGGGGDGEGKDKRGKRRRRRKERRQRNEQQQQRQEEEKEVYEADDDDDEGEEGEELLLLEEPREAAQLQQQQQQQQKGTSSRGPGGCMGQVVVGGMAPSPPWAKGTASSMNRRGAHHRRQHSSNPQQQPGASRGRSDNKVEEGRHRGGTAEYGPATGDDDEDATTTTTASHHVGTMGRHQRHHSGEGFLPPPGGTPPFPGNHNYGRSQQMMMLPGNYLSSRRSRPHGGSTTTTTTTTWGGPSCQLPPGLSGAETGVSHHYQRSGYAVRRTKPQVLSMGASASKRMTALQGRVVTLGPGGGKGDGIRRGRHHQPQQQNDQDPGRDVVVARATVAKPSSAVVTL